MHQTTFYTYFSHFHAILKDGGRGSISPVTFFFPRLHMIFLGYISLKMYTLQVSKIKKVCLPAYKKDISKSLGHVTQN